MLDSDEDEEEEQVELEEQETQQEQNKDQESLNYEQKKKKRKNRKKKKKQTNSEDTQENLQSKKKQVKDTKKEQSDLEFLDKVINETKKQQKKLGGHFYSTSDSILKMERKEFSYKRELKQLFAKSAQQYGALGIDEDEKEEKKQRGPNLDMYEGASKKMKRRLRMIEKIQEKNRVVMAKKYLLVQPNPKWPRVEKILNMEQIKTDKKTGQKVFSYIKTPEYVSLQKEFEAVQQTMDISYLMDFLRKNFYHHESLLYFADFLRLQGKFSDAFHFLERCLFAFESAWSFDYQPVPPEKFQDIDNFVPQTRLDLDREHLNKVFCECLVKYIDLIGRKGCSRTALEYCKLLLSINPQDDPFGVLLRVDYYAYRAQENGYLLKLIKQFPKEIYPDRSLASILILPNLLMTSSISQLSLREEEEENKIQNIEQICDKLMDLDEHFDKIIDIGPEALLIAATLLYPGLIESLLKKCAQNHFTGYQEKTWTEILNHELFTEIGDKIVEYHPYQWILTREQINLSNEQTSEELINDTMNKIYQIFIARSSQLFSPDHILLWMKEVIGFVLNKLDEGKIDRDLFVAKVASVTDNVFAFSRYRSLKVSDFSDDITTVNPNELLMGGAGAGGPQVANVNRGQAQNAQEAGIAAQQLQQMIQQLRQHQPNQFQQQQDLIQQQNLDNMNEQELLQLQEALIAQMGQEENININDDEDEDDYEEDEDDQSNNAGGSGFINYFQQFIPGWNQNQNSNQEQENNKEEEKKE